MDYKVGKELLRQEIANKLEDIVELVQSYNLEMDKASIIIRDAENPERYIVVSNDNTKEAAKILAA